jgi:predicted metal-binding membrane protein
MSIAGNSLQHLSASAARLGFIAARPRWVAVAVVVGLTALGWLWLALLAGQGISAWATLCNPQAGPDNIAVSAIVLLLMWSAMVLAMMLPSAAPMILTYAEIADTAARQGQSVVSPFVLAVGYIVTWLGFAAAAAAAQLGFGRLGLFGLGAAGTDLVFAGLLFTGAGVYQFSTLKQACVRLCRQPFQFFFMNWSTTSSGVFRLGLRQGAHCVGCCWAMMTLMLVAGGMNAVWMVVLAIVMTIEKMTGDKMTRGIGVALLSLGIVFVLSGFWIFGMERIP